MVILCKSGYLKDSNKFDVSHSTQKIYVKKLMEPIDYNMCKIAEILNIYLMKSRNIDNNVTWNGI